MQIQTRHFGEIEIDEKGILDFPEGLPGFEDRKKFVLLASAEEGSPFRWLQSVDPADVAFAVIDPRIIKSDYVVDIDGSEVDVLEIKNTENVHIYSILVVPEDITKMTANLKAPVLINIENKRGKQVILDNPEYPTKYYIFEHLQRTGGK